MLQKKSQLKFIHTMDIFWLIINILHLNQAQTIPSFITGRLKNSKLQRFLLNPELINIYCLKKVDCPIDYCSHYDNRAIYSYAFNVPSKDLQIDLDTKSKVIASYSWLDLTQGQFELIKQIAGNAEEVAKLKPALSADNSKLIMRSNDRVIRLSGNNTYRSNPSVRGYSRNADASLSLKLIVGDQEHIVDRDTDQDNSMNFGEGLGLWKTNIRFSSDSIDSDTFDITEDTMGKLVLSDGTNTTELDVMVKVPEVYDPGTGTDPEPGTNLPPVISFSPSLVNCDVGDVCIVNISATDPDGDYVTLQLNDTDPHMNVTISGDEIDINPEKNINAGYSFSL